MMGSNQAPYCHGLHPSFLTLALEEPFRPPTLTCVVSQSNTEMLTQSLAQQLRAGKQAETPVGGGRGEASQPSNLRK